MSENAGRLIVASALGGLTGSDAESRTRWIHVAPFGVWKGHPGGAFALTREVFDSICSDIASRKTPIALDYEHASTNPTGGPVLASGYVLRGEVRDSGLWALVELTETAAKHVASGEIRFCSGAFKFDAKDGQTAEVRPCVLHSIGLTSWPFIDGQQPITLSRFVTTTAPTGETSMSEVDMKALQKLLDAIPGPNTPDKIKKALDLMSSGDAPVSPDDVKPATAPKPDVKLTDAAPVTAADPVAPVTTSDPVMPDGPGMDPDADIDARLMAALGITDESAYAALLDKFFDQVVAVLKGGGDSAALATSRDAAVRALTATVTDLRGQLTTLTAAAREAEIAGAIGDVDGAIAAGMIQASQRDELVTLCKASPAEARRTVALVVGSHGGTVSLTQPIANVISRNTPKAVGETDPRMVALTANLRGAGLKPEDAAWKAAIKGLTTG